MPALADHLFAPPGARSPITQVTVAPPAPPCGLLKIQDAILRDAAAEVARIELRMAPAQSATRLLDHGVAAVEVLERTIHLLQVQRLALLDQLAEVLSAHHAEVPTLVQSGSTHLRASRLAGGP